MAGTNKPLIDPETGVIARGAAEGMSVEEVTDRYLARCQENSDAPTLQGLWLDIGYSENTWWSAYEKKHGASVGVEAVKRARARIEAALSTLMLRGGNNQAGVIFYMKNAFQWRDKSDDELRQSVVITLSDEVSSAIERLAETLLGR